MANVRSANTFYVDTQYAVAADELAIKNLRVLYVTVTPTAANGRIVLTDSGTNKVDLRAETSGKSVVFDYSRNPMVFATSIRPGTLTNAVATVHFEESRA